MTNHKAKFTLAVYRHTGEDAQDPFFTDALQQAEKDPSLREWLAEQQRFDSEFAAAVSEITAPNEGRALIEATMIRRPKRWTRWWPIALAASIAVMLAISISRPGGRAIVLPQNASVAELAKHLSERDPSIGLMASEYSKLSEWIVAKGGPVPGRLPPGLAQLGVIGCQTWKTNHGKVSLVCFVRENKEMIHLYVFDNSRDGSPLPAMSSPRYDRSGNWAFALWTEDGLTYALGATGDARAEESLRALFRT